MELLCSSFRSSFQGFADFDLDLLRLGRFFLREADGQHSLVVAGLNAFGAHGVRQSERTGESSEATLNAAIVLFLCFLFDFALAFDGEQVVLQTDVDFLLIQARDFELQLDRVLVFVDVDGWNEGSGSQRLFGTKVRELFGEQAIHAVLQGRYFAERFPTGQYGHNSASKYQEFRPGDWPGRVTCFHPFRWWHQPKGSIKYECVIVKFTLKGIFASQSTG